MARKKKREAEESGFTGEAAPERPRLSPVEVQQKVFRIAFRGYNERDVDEFLDHVTEDLAALHEENKRLRERAGDPAATGGVEDAQRQAEQIVRQAREHAARLLEEAEQGGGGGGPLPTSFLLGERAFLQRLAGTIQEHARWLKQEARKVQGSPRTTAETPEPAAETPPPQPAPPPEPEPQPEPPQPRRSVQIEDAPQAAAVAGAAAATAGVDEPSAAWGPPQE
ncbi:MAG: DivIVA domain-containing protein, partial [Actinomycetota bacterium]